MDGGPQAPLSMDSPGRNPGAGGRPLLQDLLDPSIEPVVSCPALAGGFLPHQGLPGSPAVSLMGLCTEKPEGHLSGPSGPWHEQVKTGRRRPPGASQQLCTDFLHEGPLPTVFGQE